MRSPSPSSYCNKLPHGIHGVTSAPCIPLTLNRNILSIAYGMVDASQYSFQQIQFLFQNEMHIYMQLDFTRCGDAFTTKVIGNAPGGHLVIPLKYRRSPKLVREFFLLSRVARNEMEQKETEMMNSVDSQSNVKRCLYLVPSVMKLGSNVVWGDNEENGYKSLIRSSIYKKGQLLKDNHHVQHGILVSGETEFVLNEIYSGRIKKRNQKMLQYARFAFASIDCSSPSNNEIICANCLSVRKILRRLCCGRFENDNKPLHKFTNTTQIVNASPSKAMIKIDKVADDLHSMQKSNFYLRSRLEKDRENHGVNIKAEHSLLLFDESVDADAKKIISSKGKEKAGKGLLSRLLWNQSLMATQDANLKGKKLVRYHLIMIRFAMMIRSKLNRGTYDFVSSVFNLPSSRLIANYDSVDGSAKDGVQNGVVRILSKRLTEAMDKANENGQSAKKIEWMRMGSLSFDSMSIKNKVKYDPHSNELVGFAEGALKEDVLLSELNALYASSPKKKDLRPDLSQQFLVFIFTSWDVDSVELKSVVARYSTASGIKAEFIVSRIREIICALYIRGFIVTNICGDGVTENRSTFKQLATITVKDLFPSSSLDRLPNEKLGIAFQHPCNNTYKVFIGGEMPHLVKKL